MYRDDNQKSEINRAIDFVWRDLWREYKAAFGFEDVEGSIISQCFLQSLRRAATLEMVHAQDGLRNLVLSWIGEFSSYS